jgi:hypothetical protein
VDEGNRTADTARELNASIQSFEDEMKEVRILLNNTLNTGLGNALAVITGALKPIATIAEFINQRLFNDVKENRPFWEWMVRVQDDQERARRHNDIFFRVRRLPPQDGQGFGP